MYKNNRDGTFTDVTLKAGVARHGWGQGVCAGDFNNDGHVDLFVSYWGDCSLWRNNGNGTFTDIAEKAGVTTRTKTGLRRWNTGCTFVDYDRDGNLDLYVANYIDFDPKTAPLPESGPCLYEGLVVACGPPWSPGRERHSLSQQWRWYVHRCKRKSRHFEEAGYLQPGSSGGRFR